MKQIDIVHLIKDGVWVSLTATVKNKSFRKQIAKKFKDRHLQLAIIHSDIKQII